MNERIKERIKELAKQAGEYVNEVYTPPVRSKTPGKIWEDGHIGWHEQFHEKFAELIVKECIHKMLNTDEQKFVVETEGWELGGANHNAWDRGILDAVATVKEHFGDEE